MSEKTENGKERKKDRPWWPCHVLKAGSLSIILLVGAVYLAGIYQIPDDAPTMIPMPDDGQYIPGPEWFFLILWQPFWFFTGMKKKYLFLTAIIPIICTIYLIALPFIHKIPFHRIPGLGILFRKIREMKKGLVKKVIYVGPIILIACLLSLSVYRSGYQAKLYGCESCHNSAMGPRMYIPPADVVEFYTVDRARQIKIGKYRAGKTKGLDSKGGKIYAIGGSQSYKDANWQMRHMYEPTFTW